MLFCVENGILSARDRVWYQINFNVLMEVIKMLGLYTNTGKIIVVKYRTTLEAPV